MKTHPPFGLTVSATNFLYNANLVRDDETVDKPRLRKMLISRECRRYRNFGPKGELELRRWIELPDQGGVCPHCGKPITPADAGVNWLKKGQAAKA